MRLPVYQRLITISPEPQILVGYGCYTIYHNLIGNHPFKHVEFLMDFPVEILGLSLVLQNLRQKTVFISSFESFDEISKFVLPRRAVTKIWGTLISAYCVFYRSC